MTDRDRYELKIAGLLHDCGKVTTPVHVVDCEVSGSSGVDFADNDTCGYWRSQRYPSRVCSKM